MSFIYLAQPTDARGHTPIAVLETADRLGVYLDSGWYTISAAAYHEFWRENARLARAAPPSTAAAPVELPPVLHCQGCQQCAAFYHDGYYECPRCHYRWRSQ
jgi:hypothetical protein